MYCAMTKTSQSNKLLIMLEQACHGTPITVRDLYKELGEVEVDMLKSGELDMEYLSALILDLVEANQNMNPDPAPSNESIEQLPE